MQTIVTCGGNLFDIAGRYLNDPNQWSLLATLNGIRDPWLNGIVSLTIPDPQMGNPVV